jgi:hypothetical protein
VSPAVLAFGSAATGTTTPFQLLTVKNTGTAPLTGGAVTLGGGGSNQFVIGTNTCSGASVATGSSCTVQVAFAPRATGSQAATLSIADNAATSPQVVSLTGSGTAPTGTAGKVTVTYSVINKWNGGLQAQIAIVNNSSVALGTATSPWVLQFKLPTAAAMVTSLWNGVEQSAGSGGVTTYTVTGPSWQASLAPGSTWDIGFTANGPGTTPTACSLDGTSCTVQAG